MSATLNAGTIANLPVAERFAAVRPYQGLVVELTWRPGKHSGWRTDRYRVVGASDHVTNGNSTGDLIVAPEEADHVFVLEDAHGNAYRSPLRSIALANIKRLEVAR